MSQPLQRKLSAIVAIDVVGYSRLVGLDEATTIEAFRRHLDELIGPEVANAGGRIVKTMGDGVLADFPSVVDAVRASIRIQEAMRVRNEDLTEDRRIVLRIGVNLGDIVIDGEDILGDGVNIAARLEAIAEPGGIALSDRAHEDVRDRLEAEFSDAGPQMLKNITRPVRVWRWPAMPKVDTGSGEDATPLILLRHLTPAGDLSSAEELAEDLFGDLLDALSHRSGVRVTVRESTGDPPTYLLEGRCRVSGDRCRLNLSMIVFANGETFWSERFDGNISDSLAFLDDVVARVSAALRAHANAFAGAAFASRADQTLTLQQLLAKGAFFFHHHDKTSSLIARAAMDEALKRAPDNPMVVSMRAWSLGHWVSTMIDSIEDVDVPQAMALADRAVALGPQVDFVFHARAWLRLWLVHDTDGCRADARRALTINPSYHKAKQDAAFADFFDGRFAEAADALNWLIAHVPPFEPMLAVMHSMLGIAYTAMGNEEAALQHAREGYERKRQVPINAFMYLAAVAAAHEQNAEKDKLKDIIDAHGFRLSDLSRLPFSRDEERNWIKGRLTQAGVPA